MPKRQTGSRSSRKRGALLDYARPESISLKVKPVLEEAPPEIKTVSVIAEQTEATEIDCKPPCESTAQGGKPTLATSTTLAVSTAALALVQDPPKQPQKEMKTFGAYELFFEIGKDSLSTTWVAKNPALEGFLSLRIFNERITDSTQVRGIQKAALKAAELTHPNHVCVYDNGVGENQAPYVVTEWIEGETLSNLFHRKKRLDIASFLNIFNQISEVLAEAHSRRLFHGNLSPQKVILATNDIEADVVKVIDFGMPVDSVQNAFYMSPEQCLDKDRIDARADIYSLGCMMYESLVGRPPSPGSQISANSVDFLHELANQYSKESQEHNALKLLDCIIKRCLQKKPAKRFSSVRELMNALGLVDDCFNRPGTKKLPHQAEKLLLFRFLDLFDKKITAALTAYLLLGLFATKYIGELQLQKLIDEAQTARFVDWPQAQANWTAAIEEARLIGKPPSLQAELQWELADTLQTQTTTTDPGLIRNNLAQDAISHYEKAYEYYSRGPHYKSYALMLLRNMGTLWFGMSDSELKVERRNAALTEARKLFKNANYLGCAKITEAFLFKFNDAEVSSYAFKANMALAAKAKPEKALTYYARAAYFCEDQTADNPAYINLNKTLEKMHLVWQFADTHSHFACKALLAGDLAAASGFAQCYGPTQDNSLINLITQYVDLRRAVYDAVDNDPNKKNAIKPLERQLDICQKAYGEHADMLTPILSRLAECYRLAGENNKAIAAYHRLLSIQPGNLSTNDTDTLAYVDLLSQDGQGQEARKVLENQLLKDGKLDTSNPLYVRLIESYSADHMQQQAKDALAELQDMPEPVKYNAQYQFVEPGSTGRPPPPVVQSKQIVAHDRAKKEQDDPFTHMASQPQERETDRSGPSADANF